MGDRTFSSVTPADLVALAGICGENNVITDSQALELYARDYTGEYRFAPETVVKPGTAEEVARVLKYCNQRLIAVTPRGAGTSLSGGALALHGGVVLSTERLNRILKIDERNFQAHVQPGVINEVLQNAVAEKGMFYPPDPASKGSCFIGGNVNHSSGGPRCVKYGTTRDYILNLQVALPGGELIWTGANTLKFSTGYNLTQLMIGSEGTLGVVTEAVVKLIPRPKENLLMLARFASARDAANAVPDIFHAGITPSAMEFMEKSGVDITVRALQLPFVVHEETEAYLLIEVDGNETERLFGECEQINGVLEKHDVQEVMFAENAAQKELFWKIRRSIGETVKTSSIYREEDTVVPRDYLEECYSKVKKIGKKYQFESVVYGHAGDGNLHVNILKNSMSDEAWESVLPQAIREIFSMCRRLGGTLSGEHGVGYVQRDYLDTVMDRTNIELMRGIKRVFDPNGILNPGKIFS